MQKALGDSSPAPITPIGGNLRTPEGSNTTRTRPSDHYCKDASGRRSDIWPKRPAGGSTSECAETGKAHHAGEAYGPRFVVACLREGGYWGNRASAGRCTRLKGRALPVLR